MNILIENGTYDCHNAGDLSMLKVCIDRINMHLPNCNLFTVTESPESLKLVHNKTKPISLLKGKLIWSNNRNVFGGLHKLIPSNKHALNELESGFRRELSFISNRIISSRLSKDSDDYIQFHHYLKTIDTTDVVIVSGGGFITDSFEIHAIRLLETIYKFVKQGKKVAFFGQGIGPIESPRLKKIAEKVFPQVTVFGLREPIKGPILLKRFGVEDSRIHVTGDDAIELAATGRQSTLGNSIGFNIRIANYAAIANSTINSLASLLKETAAEFNTDVIPIPISWHENDLVNAVNILNIDPNCIDFDNLETIEGLINQTSKCRVVITGSYHAAVFALAQGIPVIAIANSAYYIDKFEGLYSMFGVGINIISLDDLNWENILKTYLNEAWSHAEEVRDILRSKADNQISLSQNLYKDFLTSL